MTDTTERVSTDIDPLSIHADEKGTHSTSTPEGSDLESDPDEEPDAVPTFPGMGTERSQDADQQDSDDVPETFPREYVEQLRNESGRYRQRAQQADTYAQRLHVELVRATGRLADPTDLSFVEDHLVDADKLAGAIDDLLRGKPHLASRRPAGDIGQGATPSGGPVDLAAILRGNA